MIQTMERTNRIYLVRHGQVKAMRKFPYWSYGCGFDGDRPASTGKMAERLRLDRARRHLCQRSQKGHDRCPSDRRYHNVPVHFLPELREMYFGDWEGRHPGSNHSDYPEEVEKRKKDPAHYACPGGGESPFPASRKGYSGFLRKSVLKRSARRLLSWPMGGQSGHSVHALGLDLSRAFNIVQDYGCLNIIDYFPDAVGVKLMNG
jgi:alpha-ribazole phosphatase